MMIMALGLAMVQTARRKDRMERWLGGTLRQTEDLYSRLPGWNRISYAGIQKGARLIIAMVGIMLVTGGILALYQHLVEHSL